MGPLVKNKQEATRHSVLGAPIRADGNKCSLGLCFAGWIFLLLAEISRSQEKTPWATLALRLLLQMCQSRWVWAHGSISTTWALLHLLGWELPEARVVRGALTPPEQAALLPEISQKQGHGENTCFFHSLRFSQFPNYNFRIQQRSRTLRSFPQKFQVHQKAVVQTRWHGKKHHQSSP